MKRYFFWLLFSILFSNSSIAQKIGVEIIINPKFSDVLFSNDLGVEGFSSVLKFSAGLGGDISLTDRSRLGLALLFDGRGANDESVEFRDENNDPIKGGVKYRSNFLTMPVTYRYRTGQGIKWQFESGMYFSYRLNEKLIYPEGFLTLGNPSDPLSGTNEFDETGLYKKFDMGIVMSISSYFSLNDSMLLQLGVNNYFSTVNLSELDGFSLYQNSIGLIAGINIALTD